MDDNTMLTPTPDEKWSLAHLGEFCVQRFGKMASDAWWIGKAMRLAKEKAGGKFKAWKLEHGFSDSMASRYMRLCEAYKSPELLEGKRIYPRSTRPAFRLDHRSQNLRWPHRSACLTWRTRVPRRRLAGPYRMTQMKSCPSARMWTDP